MKRKGIKYFLAGAVALLTFGVYLPALQNSFVEWDDSAYVFENLHIRSFDLAFLRWAFFDFYAANWHPLTWISHALDYALWGLNPLGHHLTNNVLHAINTFLVVLLVVRLLERRQADKPTTQQANKPGSLQPAKLAGFSDSSAEGGPARGERFTFIAAAVTGLLFGLHPLHVESVAWVAERKDLLCALFYLLSIMMYVKYATHVSQRAKGIEHRAEGKWTKEKNAMLYALCFFVLALMSKPMAVSLPIVLLILDWYPFKRITSFKTFMSAVVEKLPFIALSLFSSVVTILAQKADDAILSVEAVPLSIRTIIAVRSLVFYLWKMALPFNLVPFYLYPSPKGVSLFSAYYLLAILLVVGISVFSLVIVKKQKLWLSVWGYYVVTLLPVIGIVQVGAQAMADRYSYLPSIGPFLIAGLAVAWVFGDPNAPTKREHRFNFFSTFAVLLLFTSMAYMTISQIRIWKNSIDLWNHVITKEPRVYFAYNNRGIVLYGLGRIDEAIEDYQKALSLNPMHGKSHYNLGLALFEKGFVDAAIGEYETAIKLNPRDVNAHLNLGVAYARKGLTDRSIGEYQIVESLKPGSAEPFFQLGAFLSSRGFLDEAIQQLQIAVRIKPDFADARSNLGAALFRKGRIADALEHYLIYSQLRPNDAAAHLNLGSAYAALGYLDKGMDQFQIALRLNPGLADAHYNLGMAYQAKGFMDKAVEHLEAAAHLNPTDAAIRNDLARLKNYGRE